MIDFIFWSVVCIGIWFLIAHVSTYKELKQKHIKEEYKKDFTFFSYLKDEYNHWVRHR